MLVPQSVKNLAIFISSAAVFATPLVAQSDGNTFEGQFFSASVKNVARSAKTGRVIVTVLFRGKDFGNSHNVGLNGIGDPKACVTLIDDAGGSYQSKSCLPYPNNNGTSEMIIKASTDTLMAFEFMPDVGTTISETAEYNLVIPFQLLTCKTVEQGKLEGRNDQFGDNDTCMGGTYKYSDQSMSFYGLVIKRPNITVAAP
jgi:hypothetical protein